MQAWPYLTLLIRKQKKNWDARLILLIDILRINKQNRRGLDCSILKNPFENIESESKGLVAGLAEFSRPFY